MSKTGPAAGRHQELELTRQQVRLVAEVVMHLAAEVWLASDTEEADPEELYLRLVRTTQALQASVLELRDALCLAFAGYEAGGTPTLGAGKVYNAF